MRCREVLGQRVMTIFYEVNPTDVKKQTGVFGKAFRRTCKGKTKEEIETWRKALEDVATIAGYHSSKWVDEAAMIEKIATDVSNMLNESTVSRDFDRFIGMGAHMEKIKLMLRLDLDEVRMIGIWGPPGIGKKGKTLFDHVSSSFQLRAIMVNIKERYPRPCLDEGTAQLGLQTQMLCQMINHKDIMITHLGVAQERLKDKKVLLVLDDVDRLAQLDALAREVEWFGPKSRIIITAEDVRVLKAHGIKHIYKVDFPSHNEAFEIFCMNAFRQKQPYKGFYDLAREVTELAGNLPLGLQVLGSALRGMSKQEWKRTLPRLKTCLDGKIESILKFSHDALCDKEKDLFLYIACFSIGGRIDKVEEHLMYEFSDVRQGLGILFEKSLISFQDGWIDMHKLLIQLGREIVRNEPRKRCEPGQCQFLVDAREIREILTDDTGSRSVLGINFDLSQLSEELNISKRAFKGMPNLEYLKFHFSERLSMQNKWSHISRKILDTRFDEHSNKLYLPQGLNGLSQKLRLLEWERFPMTCLPSDFCIKYLVELKMRHSKLQKLWESNQPLGNLKYIDLSYSEDLKELPNLSTATKLEEVILIECSSLVELIFSDVNVINLHTLYLSGCSNMLDLSSCIGNATNLVYLDLSGCSSMVYLPSSIGDATNLLELDLSGCSSLVELPISIENLLNLKQLNLKGCSSLVELPSSIGNATNLEELDLSLCTGLVELPSSIGNLQKLVSLILEGCSKVKVLPININLESLYRLVLTDCSHLESFPAISTNITYLDLRGTAVQEVPLLIGSWTHLETFLMTYCEDLKESPHALGSITELQFNNEEIQEIPPWVNKFSRLSGLVVNGCKKLVSLPQLPDSLCKLDAANCDSLERLDYSFQNPEIHLKFSNYFKLNKEERQVIIQTSTRSAVLPGKKVPAHFTHQMATGCSMKINLNQRRHSTTSRFKAACILLVNKGVVEAGDGNMVKVICNITFKHNEIALYSLGIAPILLPTLLKDHLCIIEVQTGATFTEVIFEFKIPSENCGIGEGGVFQLPDLDNSKTAMDFLET